MIVVYMYFYDAYKQVICNYNYTLMLKPEVIYWITAAIIAVYGVMSEDTVDISTHDTYIVIANFYIMAVLAIMYVIFGFIHLGIRASKRKVSKILFVIHYFFTTICLIVLFFNSGFIAPEPYEDYSVLNEFDTYNQMQAVNLRISILVLTIALAQVIFISNIIRSLILKKESI